MRKGLQRKKDENFAQWCERLATALTVRKPDPDELQEVLHVVSKESYLAGVEAERKAQKKWRGWE